MEHNCGQVLSNRHARHQGKNQPQSQAGVSVKSSSLQECPPMQCTAQCQEDEGQPEVSCPRSCRQSYSPMSFGCYGGSEPRHHSPGTLSPALLLPRPHTQQSKLPRRAQWSLLTGHTSGSSSSISPCPPRRSDSTESQSGNQDIPARLKFPARFWEGGAMIRPREQAAIGLDALEGRGGIWQ